MVQRNNSIVVLLSLVLTMGCKQDEDGLDPNADADGDGILTFRILGCSPCS